MNRAAYTARGRTRRVRGIPSPVANYRAAQSFAWKWLTAIGTELEDDFGRERVPERVHAAVDRLVQWAAKQAGR